MSNNGKPRQEESRENIVLRLSVSAARLRQTVENMAQQLEAGHALNAGKDYYRALCEGLAKECRRQLKATDKHDWTEQGQFVGAM